MRYHATTEGNTPFTPEEEAAFDANILPLAIKEALDQIKKERDALINSNFNNVQVASPEDRENINGAIDYYDILTSSGANPLMWTMADNSVEAVTKEDLQSFKDGYIIRKAQIFAEYQTKRALLSEATTVDQVNAILEG